jgi:hypothetical protein
MNDFGALAPIVFVSGQIMAAAIALFAVVSGRSFWAPAIPGLPQYAIRVFGVITGIGVVIFYKMSRNGTSADVFGTAALWAGAIGVVGALVYLFSRQTLSFTCKGDPTLYVLGLKLKWPAKAVLSGTFDNLPPQYASAKHSPPTSQQEYFCKSGKDADFIWERWSHALAQVLLVAAYGLAMVPLTLALASGSIALGIGS